MLELGAAAGAERLRELLEGGDPEARAEAAQALALLGQEADGPRLVRVVEGAPELAPVLGWFGRAAHVGLLLEAATVAGATHLGHQTAHAVERITGLVFEPALVHDERSTCPAIDPDPWSARFEERSRDRPLPEGRLRWGRPWTAEGIVDELEDRRAMQGARRVLARELRMATAGRAWLDVDGWVAAQRRKLQEMRAAHPWRTR
jgi:hypothetical protein